MSRAPADTTTRRSPMAYEVPPLPYDYNALEPTIDEATMKLHHDKHHQAYVDKANDALQGTDHDGKPVEEVLANLSSLPADQQGPFRNNGGGHANHTLFWESMSPDGGGEPSGELADAISDAFGSFDTFKEQFEANGVGQFGSGWTWLVLDNGRLGRVVRLASPPPRAGEHRSRTHPGGPGFFWGAGPRCLATTSGSTPTT